MKKKKFFGNVINILSVFGLLFVIDITEALSSSTWVTDTHTQRINTIDKDIDFGIDMPNFDNFFSKIQSVSPLARQAFQYGTGGFAALKDNVGTNIFISFEIC